MELFIDTASIDDIREIARWGCLSGVTTNPSLIAKEEGGFTAILEEITQLVDGPISAEVVSATADEMVPEARELAALHPNIIIKVPMCAEGLAATVEWIRRTGEPSAGGAPTAGVAPESVA